MVTAMLGVLVVSRSAAEPPQEASEKAGDAAPEKQHANEPPAFLPTDQFKTVQIEGFTVRVARPLIDERPELWHQVQRELQSQLYRVGRVVPAGPLAKLRKVTIWVEDGTMPKGAMAYHPNVNWLREHGVNPDKAKGAELGNVAHFLAWTGHQPWMLLHELAHAYHDQFLGGYGNEKIKAAYDKAIADGLYDSALLYNGKRVRAYAATNPMEYFAETSEAYFGTNDFYPFVQAELREHDPRMFALLEKLWETGSSKGR
jgi:hypothetical protein